MSIAVQVRPQQSTANGSQLGFQREWLAGFVQERRCPTRLPASRAKNLARSRALTARKRQLPADLLWLRRSARRTECSTMRARAEAN